MSQRWHRLNQHLHLEPPPSIIMSILDLRPEHKKQFIAFYKHLPDEFFPIDVIGPPDDVPEDKWTRDEWSRCLCKTFPRSHIPAKLKPKPGVNFQPPRFLFGWAMEQSVLRAIAKQCGFAEHFLPFDYNKISADLTCVIWSRYPEIVQQFGWTFVARIMVHDKGLFFCLALADSWMTGNGKPSVDQINAVQGFLGIGKGAVVTLADNEPMWWADLNCYQWHYRHKWECLRDFRPWDFECRLETLNSRG
ncbi:hypothetical protein NMY22_g613 [Coprinellus aureogranulatus]|nr:hypothetical protein NMY22_g613 [Coprinellus aureogranulatus]